MHPAGRKRTWSDSNRSEGGGPSAARIGTRAAAAAATAVVGGIRPREARLGGSAGTATHKEAAVAAAVRRFSNTIRG